MFNHRVQGSSPKSQEGKGLRLFFLMLLLVGQLAASPVQASDPMTAKYQNQLVRIIAYRDSLEGVHPFVRKLYPVAIVEDGNFYVFNADEAYRTYHLAASAEVPMPIPKGVRAAFPLEFWDNRCACVVTGEVFDTPQGYVTIFHEFIHCHQWHTVEPGLRRQLPLAIKAMQNKDYMWELNHAFPYQDAWFVDVYSRFVKAAAEGDKTTALALRREMAALLNEDDYQYMVWQEWKEGFALWIENQLRQALDIPHNPVGTRTPYNRTAFYAGGSAFIHLLGKGQPELLTDLEALFFKMYHL